VLLSFLLDLHKEGRVEFLQALQVVVAASILLEQAAPSACIVKRAITSAENGRIRITLMKKERKKEKKT
jgi:hypothetical protein